MFDLAKPTLKARLANGPALGAYWFALGNLAMIESAVLAGAEAIIIDMQHGLFDRALLEAAFGLVPASVPRLVRVEDQTPAAIGRALDAGAEGVIVPLVETAEQARSIAAACHYPPKGIRSGGGVRPTRDFGRYVATARSVAVGVMIETKRGLQNAKAIAAAQHVDFTFIGTGDLALSLGTTPGSEAHTAACRKIRDASRAAGVPCGTFTMEAESAARRIADGFAMTIIANDVTMVNTYFGEAESTFRAAMKAAIIPAARKRPKTKR